MNPYTHRATCRIEATETLDEILCALSPELTFVVYLILVDGLAVNEIADFLGVTRQTVSTRLRMAREEIRRQLPHLAPEIDGRSRGGNGGVE